MVPLFTDWMEHLRSEALEVMDYIHFPLPQYSHFSLKNSEH